MSGLPNLIYRFNTILIKTPASYFVVIDKLVTKVYMEMAKDPETLFQALMNYGYECIGWAKKFIQVFPITRKLDELFDQPNTWKQVMWGSLVFPQAEPRPSACREQILPQ